MAARPNGKQAVTTLARMQLAGGLLLTFVASVAALNVTLLFVGASSVVHAGVAGLVFDDAARQSRYMGLLSLFTSAFLQLYTALYAIQTGFGYTKGNEFNIYLSWAVCAYLAVAGLLTTVMVIGIEVPTICGFMYGMLSPPFQTRPSLRDERLLAACTQRQVSVADHAPGQDALSVTYQPDSFQSMPIGETGRRQLDATLLPLLRDFSATKNGPSVDARRGPLSFSSPAWSSSSTSMSGSGCLAKEQRVPLILGNALRPVSVHNLSVYRS